MAETDIMFDLYRRENGVYDLRDADLETVGKFLDWTDDYDSLNAG